MAIRRTLTYSNPVWPEYFADPFVLKSEGMYYAYGTGPANAKGWQFPVLRSPDLVHWEYVGHALTPLRDPPANSYWAPEVAEQDGAFYLYYSASGAASDDTHRLRVATAGNPTGPFTDSGKLLLPNAGFSIDAHPFRDPLTGSWYLFFATDYLEEEPHGTGLAVVALKDDMLTVSGEPRRVVRASSDWQVYERNRNYLGRVWPAWFCVEGPFVLYHDRKYYCLYSGGAWNSENYGLGYAVADDPLGPYADDYAQHGPSVLRGTRDEVIGPGHNSVVIGPDDQTLFAVYHAWDKAHTARRMCIDPIVWTKDGPTCDGPSTGERVVELQE